jgi:hypothetical protein
VEIQKLDSQVLESFNLDNEKIQLVVSFDHKEDHAKKVHDLKNAIRRLEILKGMIEEGFDFTASDASGLKTQLNEAIQVIKTNVAEVIAIREFSC